MGMLNITSKAILKIKTYLAGKKGTPQEIAGYLNTVAFDNSLPRSKLKVKLDFAGFKKPLGPSSLGTLAKYAHLPQIIADLKAQDHEQVGHWIDLLSASGTITTAEATELTAYASSSTDDPSWKARISWIEREFGSGKLIDEDEVLDNGLNK